MLTCPSLDARWLTCLWWNRTTLLDGLGWKRDEGSDGKGMEIRHVCPSGFKGAVIESQEQEQLHMVIL